MTGAVVSGSGVPSLQSSATSLTEIALAFAYFHAVSLLNETYEVVLVATNVKLSTTFVAPVTIFDDAITVA